MKHVKLTAIQCYALTDDANDDEKDKLYQVLNDTTAKMWKRDMVIVLGDMNAKIGRENKDHEETMGGEGCGERNENEQIPLDYCHSNNLTMGGSIFLHKNTRKCA